MTRSDEAPEPERTADGRYLIINGRRWRASDPDIPEALRAELVTELARARRLVRSEGDRARPFVQDAKVALGERGEPWWEQASDAGRRERIAAAMRTLLRNRPTGTICPSDAARIAGADGWRSLMDAAREVATRLQDERVVEVRQKAAAVDPRTAKGPLRIAAGPELAR